MLELRALGRDDIATIATLDRGEVINAIYRVEAGSLVLRPEHHAVTGWSAGDIAALTSALNTGCENGDWIMGTFDAGRLVGFVMLARRLFGPRSEYMQLVFLYVDRSRRGCGIGKSLFSAAAAEARSRGAERLYVSATPTQGTVDFYLGRGCRLIPEPDAALFDKEPDDIHLSCRI